MAIHRPTLFNLMNCIVGVSILAIPYCFHQSGVILGALAMIVMMFLTKKSCSFLLLSSQLARRRSYESLAHFTYGSSGKLAVEICIIGLMAGTLCAFNVIIGDLGPEIVHHTFSIVITPSMRATMMILIAYGLALPLSLMRDISSLANLSAVSLMFYAMFLTQVLFNSIPYFFSGEWVNAIHFWRPEGFLKSLPIFALSFSCQTQLFGLYDSIPEPSIKKMDSVINVGLNIVCSIYLAVGFFSYVTYYNVGVKGDVLTNYGYSFVANCLKLGFMMSVIVSFPLMVFPMRASINSLLFPSQTAGTENMPGGPGYMPQNRFVYITVAIITMTLMIGILIPQIEFILGLTGATMGLLISLILPASMFLYVVQESINEHRIIAKLVLTVGFICLVASTYSILTATNNQPQDLKPTVNQLATSPTVENLIPTSMKIPSNLSELKSVKPPHTAPVETSKVDVPDIKANIKKLDEKIIKEKKPEEKKVEEKKVEEVGQVEEKRVEPVLPHAPEEKKDEVVPPADKAADDGGHPDKGSLVAGDIKEFEKPEKGADPLSEKRQLMSTDDSKPEEPQKLARTGDLNQMLKKSPSEKKDTDVVQSNHSKMADSKTNDLKSSKNKSEKILDPTIKETVLQRKTESREKRQADDLKSTETTMESNSKGSEKDVAGSKTSKEEPKEMPSNSSVVIVEPKQTSSASSDGIKTTVKPVLESSSLLLENNQTGEVVKGRELKSSDILGRRLHSVNERSSIWKERLKKRGSLRVKRQNKRKIGLS